MTCDLYFQLLLRNDSLKVMSVMHCNNAHIIIPFIIHIILLKLTSYRNQPTDLLHKPTDWFLMLRNFPAGNFQTYHNRRIVDFKVAPIKRYAKLPYNKASQQFISVKKDILKQALGYVASFLVQNV